MGLGSLSEDYESSGDPAAINKHDDDHGGMSYGAYQFYSGAGVVQNFITWLSSEDNYYKALAVPFDGLTATTEEFNAAWESVATQYPAEFLEAQYEYAKAQYFDVAVEQLKKIGYTTDSAVLQNIIWSCAIQYSPYKVPKLFNEAAQWIGLEDCTKITEEKRFIAAVYYIRCTDEWNKGNRGMCYRMFLECRDAFNMGA
jgi:hypothetical protein